MSRPSLRHGLPYGWWRSEALGNSVSVLLIVASLALILAAWFGGAP